MPGMLLWRAVQMIAVMLTVTMLSTAWLSSEDIQKVQGLNCSHDRYLLFLANSGQPRFFQDCTLRNCDDSEMVSLKVCQPSTTIYNTIPPRDIPSDVCYLRSRYINVTVHHDTRPIETRHDTMRLALAEYFRYGSAKQSKLGLLYLHVRAP